MTAVLATKLFEPVLPRGVVARPRLASRLGGPGAPRIALVAAPAGSGKSTLLGEWCRSADGAVAWLSVDAGDDDPIRFWRHVAAALGRVAPGVGDALDEALTSGRRPPLRPLVEDLVNELAAWGSDVTLALDDLHAIGDDDVLASLGHLLGNLPPNARAVISTRTEPRLPIATWRARGELVEVRAADLRLTRDEVAVYLAGAGIELDDESLELLVARTEGWPAGVHLAALTLVGRTDEDARRAFVRTFAGDHRAVGDYLLEEVLERQPPEVQQFLVTTSLLDRLCGPLCDAITLRDDGQAMLEALDAANLFLVPLDGTRTWYRYHHLFADLLRRELRERDEALIGELHGRAARWLMAEGLAAHAVPHAVAARAWDLVVGLGAEHGFDFVQQGDVTAFRQLYGAPDDTFRRRPEALLGFAWLAMLMADLDGARAWLDQVDAGNREHPEDVPIDGLLDTELLRMVLASRAGERSQVARTADTVLAMLDAHPEVTGLRRGARRGRALLFHVREAIWQDDLRGARDRLDEVDAAHRGHHVVRNQIEAAGIRALLTLWDGRVAEALASAGAALALEAQRELAGAPHGTWARLTVAWHHLERLELEEAESLLTHALEVSRHHRDVQCIGVVGATWAAWLRFAGLPAESIEAVRITRAELRGVPEVAPTVERRLARADALAHAALGDVDGAVRAAGDAPSGPTLARLALLGGRTAEAAERALAAAHDAARAPGRRHDHIESLAIAALACRADGDLAAAHASLAEAERLAAVVGWSAPFVDLGTPMRDLLERAPSSTDRSVARLRADVVAVLGGRLAAGAARDGLVEPLSEREQAVLRRLPSSMSNQEIAAALYVSLNTVKTQLQSVYRKLGVGSRHEAIERARAIGLL